MKIFVASFNRASNGALEHLICTMRKNNLFATHHSDADYILACGDRMETFDFILKRFRENKPIIHLWAGEISQGTHDEVYRHAITLMSIMQLCTNNKAFVRVTELCRAVDKEPNAYVVGNVMFDDLTVDESTIPKEPYCLILYNPSPIASEREVLSDIREIHNQVADRYVWVESNGDAHNRLVQCNLVNQPRPVFLGLLKNCRMFLTNSSCQYYEAPFFLKPEQIISIGKRNAERESRYADMTITGATDKIIKIFNILK